MKFPLTFPVAHPPAAPNPDWKPLPEDVAELAAEVIACATDPNHELSAQALAIAATVAHHAPAYAPGHRLADKPEEA